MHSIFVQSNNDYLAICAFKNRIDKVGYTLKREKDDNINDHQQNVFSDVAPCARHDQPHNIMLRIFILFE